MKSDQDSLKPTFPAPPMVPRLEKNFTIWSMVKLTTWGKWSAGEGFYIQNSSKRLCLNESEWISFIWSFDLYPTLVLRVGHNWFHQRKPRPHVALGSPARRLVYLDRVASCYDSGTSGDPIKNILGNWNKRRLRRHPFKFWTAIWRESPLLGEYLAVYGIFRRTCSKRSLEANSLFLRWIHKRRRRVVMPGRILCVGECMSYWKGR